MKNYFEVFNYIMGIVQMLAGFHYYTKFLGKKMHPVGYPLFALIGSAVTAKIQGDGLYSFIVYILMLMIWGFLVCRADFAAVVLYAVVTSEIMQLCYGIFDSVLCILFPLLFSFSREIVGITFMIVGNMAVFAVICCCRRVYCCFVGDETLNGQYAALILMPTMLIFLISEYIHFIVYGNTVTIDDKGTVINANHYQMLVIQLLGIASLFCIMAAYKKLLANVRVNTELSLLRQQEQFLYQYVEEAKSHYESTKSFRHDIKNHITVVRELLQHDKIRQAIDYVSDMEEITGGLSFPYSTGNPVVDILLGNKLGIAKSHDIDVRCSLVLPYPGTVRDIDICIILSNALDNAIHACKNMGKDTEKYICVTGNIQGDFILIEIENSFEGGKMFKEGTGLSNIKKIAEKYQGAVSIKIEDTVVVLSVLLINRRCSE